MEFYSRVRQIWKKGSSFLCLSNLKPRLCWASQIQFTISKLVYLRLL
jgi:hypothetical protein